MRFPLPFITGAALTNGNSNVRILDEELVPVVIRDFQRLLPGWSFDLKMGGPIGTNQQIVYRQYVVLDSHSLLRFIDHSLVATTCLQRGSLDITSLPIKRLQIPLDR